MEKMWIVSSFEDFVSRGAVKHQKLSVNEIALSNEQVWMEKFQPKNLIDLAVNPKKVQEVYDWLSNAFSGNIGRAPVAILSGPSGSGKTTTLRVLAKTMPFNIKEWVTPTCSKASHFDNEEQRFFRQDGQLKKFEDFLFQASRYPSLFDDSLRRHVLLVEDIPNIYVHNPPILEETLRKYLEIGLSPLVFICSNGSNEFNLERLLFKPYIQKDLGLTNISFNPITKSMMIKAIKRIIALQENDSNFRLPYASEDSIEHIADVSCSDIRFAINQLQFGLSAKKGLWSPTGKYSKIVKKNKRKRKPFTKTSTSMKGKDHFLDVFRCVGRVLYCKKEETTNNPLKGVEQKLCHDPEEIVSQMYTIPTLFYDLLCENYLSVFNDMKSILKAADCLSQSDIILSRLKDRNNEIYYGLNISVLGLMNSSSENINRKWTPFRGSRYKKISTCVNERMALCKQLLRSEECIEIQTYMREVIPYYSRMNRLETFEDMKDLVKMISDLQPVSIIPAEKVVSTYNAEDVDDNCFIEEDDSDT